VRVGVGREGEDAGISTAVDEHATEEEEEEEGEAEEEQEEEEEVEEEEEEEEERKEEGDVFIVETVGRRSLYSSTVSLTCGGQTTIPCERE
jgi:thioredoxin reductase